MKRFLTLTKSLLLQILRNPQTLFWNLVFPIFLLVIYNFVFGRYAVAGTNFMTWVVPGIIALNIMSFGLIGGATNIVDMREKGVLRRLRATPLPPLQFIGANLVNYVGVCLLQSISVVIAARVLFGVSYPIVNLLLALPLVLISIVVFVAIGQVISGVAQKMGIALAISQLLYFAQMFISDTVMPADQLPEWLRAIMPWLPSYVMGDLIRPAFLSGGTNERFLFNLVLMLGYGGIAAVIAAKTFRWDPKA